MKFRLLGPGEADFEGRPIDLGGPKPRLLLAVLLAAEQRFVTIEQLLGRVWHDGLPKGSDREIVHSCVSDLRGILKQGEPGADSWIPKREAGYRLLVKP